MNVLNIPKRYSTIKSTKLIQDITNKICSQHTCQNKICNNIMTYSAYVCHREATWFYVGPSIFSGRTHLSKSGSDMRPRSSADWRRVRCLWWAWLAMRSAASYPSTGFRAVTSINDSDTWRAMRSWSTTIPVTHAGIPPFYKRNIYLLYLLYKTAYGKCIIKFNNSE